MQLFETAAPTLGPDLLRGARAMLGWSLMTAGQRAGVSVSTVISAEGRGVKPSPARLGDVDKLRRAYEEAGMRFLDGAGTGRGLRIEDR